MRIYRHGAYPDIFPHIEFNSGRFAELGEGKTAIEGTDGQAVGFRNVVDIIGRYNMARARHILYNYGRLAGYILGQVLGHETARIVITASGVGAHNYRDRLPLIVRRRAYSASWKN